MNEWKKGKRNFSPKEKIEMVLIKFSYFPQAECRYIVEWEGGSGAATGRWGRWEKQKPNGHYAESRRPTPEGRVNPVINNQHYHLS